MDSPCWNFWCHRDYCNPRFSPVARTFLCESKSKACGVPEQQTAASHCLDALCRRQQWQAWDDTTNVAKLMAPEYSVLGHYSKSAAIYQCTADFYVSPEQKPARLTRRIRNVSINHTMGLPPPENRSIYWNYYANTAHLSRSAPSHRFVFIDTHPETTRERQFFIDAYPDRSFNGFANFPGSLHNGSGTLSFADTHAEAKRWRVADTMFPVRFAELGVGWPPHNNESEDYRWLWARTGEPVPFPF